MTLGKMSMYAANESIWAVGLGDCIKTGKRDKQHPTKMQIKLYK